MGNNHQYRDLADYCKRTGAKRIHVARHLGVSRFQFAGLQAPALYPVPQLSSDLVNAISALLGQTPAYVRAYYRKAAA